MYKGLKNETEVNKPFKTYYSIMMKRVLIIGGITLITFLVPFKTLVNIYHSNNPEYANLLIQSIENPNNPIYKEELVKYHLNKRR